MKNLTKLFLLLLLATALIFSVFGCKPAGNDDNEIKDFELEGEYAIDITNLGMALVFYLKIEDNADFKLSNTRDYTVDKGHGTVAKSGSTYMLIFSDSTIETPKTSTFTVENNNLHFSSNLPYGASNLPFSKVDEEDETITYYLVAKTYLYEEHFGEYIGGHDASAGPNGMVQYTYSFILGVGCEYTFYSEFEMLETLYNFSETGTYSIEGTAITITPKGGEAVTGVINTNNSIDIAIKPSSMATTRTSRNLVLAPNAKYAATYYGYTTFMGTSIANTTLTLDKIGGYTYEVTGDSTYTETGTYSVTGTTYSFTKEGATTAVDGTYANFTLTATFSIGYGPTKLITFYRQNIQGSFSATTTVEEVVYHSLISLNNNGSYTLTMSNSPETELLNESGTFMLKPSMSGITLELTSGSIVRSFSASFSDITGKITISDVEYGFKYSKAVL